MQISYLSNWRTEHICCSCKAEISDNIRYYSSGRCPYCGYKGKYAGTIVDTEERAYRIVRHGKWWQFWIKPVREYAKELEYKLN